MQVDLYNGRKTMVTIRYDMRCYFNVRSKANMVVVVVVSYGNF